MAGLQAYFPITSPTLIFLVVLLIILLAPIIMGKLRIPHIIGMVLAGVLVGKYGLNILVRDDSFELFGRVGLYYIMFLASLEMDIEGIKKNRKRLVIFGLLTFLVPFGLIYASGINLLHASSTASLLLGCIMASNTLVAYPIVSRFGLQRKVSVNLSVGSSMISLLLALVVLAITVSAATGHGGIWSVPVLLLKLMAYCVLMTLLIPRLTRWFLRRYSDAVMQYIFVLCVLFFCAAVSDAIGLEGIFGAFFAGLILNRYIPHLSPLMNRIEFIGNAIFIPYFLIGVGMLINVRLLFQSSNVLAIAITLVIVGTLAKAIAAYFSGVLFKLPLSSAHMMFGLTSAHAAGAIAMVMVGMELADGNGQPTITPDMLNGVVIMILFTCIISSIVTQYASRKIIMRDQDMPAGNTTTGDDERILVPVKYPEYAERLMDLAVMMHNHKLNRELVALNVVYDDEHMKQNLEKGHRLLEKVAAYAAATDVKVVSQVRVAANIANGIKHAFKEFNASEIIIGMHMHKDISTKFWGQFHQSLFNGLSRQIIMARFNQPLNTIRRIVVAVPSRAEFEPGFHRWLERLARVCENLECKTVFYGRPNTLALIRQFMNNRHPMVRTEFNEMSHWNELPQLAAKIASDHLFVVVAARQGTVSYKAALEHLPDELAKHYSGKNLMIIFPDQYGGNKDSMTFAQPQHTEEVSAYTQLSNWVWKIIQRIKF